jgi:hypothetical protein
MCLLITGGFAKLQQTLLDTPSLLDNIFSTNEDGVGVMYANQGVVNASKLLPKTTIELRAWVAALEPQYPEQQIAMHFRMRTHGDINFEQCHPYPIPDTGAWLMHNGILSSGNAEDKTKSDTWHYAKDVLAPIAAQSADLLHNLAIQKLLSRDIGSTNKFAILTPDGQLSVTNRSSGVEHDGLWFSNTYAWSPELLVPGYKKALVYYSGGTYNKHDHHEHNHYEYDKRTKKWTTTWADASLDVNSKESAAEYLAADVLAGNYDDLVDLLCSLTNEELVYSLNSFFQSYVYTVIYADGKCPIETMTSETLALGLSPEELASLLIYQTAWGLKDTTTSAACIEPTAELVGNNLANQTYAG